MNSKLDGVDSDSIYTRLIGYGSALLFSCLPIVLLPYLGVRVAALDYIGPIPILPDQISLVPQFNQVGPQQWVVRLINNIVYMSLIAVSYITCLGTTLGVVMVLAGAVRADNPSEVIYTIIDVPRRRSVQLGLSVYALFVLWIVDPATFRFIAETIIFIAVSGALFVTLGTGWLALRSRSNTIVRIGILYPLGLGTLVLPVIGGGLVAPTLAVLTKQFTSEVAVTLQDIFLAPIGLERWVSRTFALEGVSFFLLWVSLATIIGWVIGPALEFLDDRYGILPAQS